MVTWVRVRTEAKMAVVRGSLPTTCAARWYRVTCMRTSAQVIPPDHHKSPMRFCTAWEYTWLSGAAVSCEAPLEEASKNASDMPKSTSELQSQVL